MSEMSSTVTESEEDDFGPPPPGGLSARDLLFEWPPANHQMFRKEIAKRLVGYIAVAMGIYSNYRNKRTGSKPLNSYCFFFGERESGREGERVGGREREGEGREREGERGGRERGRGGERKNGTNLGVSDQYVYYVYITFILE